MRGTDGVFTYNPEPDHVITEGTTLVVLGETDSIVLLRQLVTPGWGQPAPSAPSI